MAVRLLRVVWGGSIHTGGSEGNPIVEIWSNSLCLESSPTAETQQAAVAAAVSAHHQNSSAHISAECHLEYCKVNEVDLVTGKQITDPTSETIYNPPIPGGDGTISSNVPITTAIRISLLSGLRGRLGNGGWYQPCPTENPGQNWRWSQATVTDVLGAAETFVQALNAIPGAGVVVASPKSLGGFRVTRFIRVGDVPDNIRSRKNNLEPAYQTSPEIPISSS